VGLWLRRRHAAEYGIATAGDSLIWQIVVIDHETIMAKTEGEFNSIFSALVRGIGLAIHEWAQVEDSMFSLFHNLLRSSNEEISSIVFYSCPSFESKRVLMDRLASVGLSAEDNATWTVICKKLTDEGEFRGRIAHYGIETKISNLRAVLDAEQRGETLEMEFHEPILRRTPKNKIPIGKKVRNKPLISRTTISDVFAHIELSRKLREEIDDFTKAIAPKYPNPLLQGLTLGRSIWQPRETPEE
jgi:hypothetical protein